MMYWITLGCTLAFGAACGLQLGYIVGWNSAIGSAADMFNKDRRHAASMSVLRLYRFGWRWLERLERNDA